MTTARARADKGPEAVVGKENADPRDISKAQQEAHRGLGDGKEDGWVRR